MRSIFLNRLRSACLGGLLGVCVLAEEPLGLDGAIARARSMNPELMAARVLIREAKARVVQAGRLTNPELEAAAYPNLRGREGFLTLALVQRFPLTSRLRLEKAVSKVEVEVAEAEVADRERRLAGEVMEGVVNWIAMESQRRLKEQQWTNSQELVRVSAAVAGRGEASAVDGMRFRVESERLMFAMRQMESGLVTQEGQLRYLLGMAEAEPIRLEGELGKLVSPPTQETVGLELRPDHLAVWSRRRSAELMVALVRANRWQDIGVGLAGQIQRSEDAPTGLQRDNFVGLQVSLPLPFWNRNEGRISEAREAMIRTELEYRSVEIRIRAEVDAAWGRLRVAEAALKGVEERMLPAAREVEVAMARLKSEGQANVTDQLLARDGRFEAESTRLEALRDLDLARGRLAVATGAITQENKR